ncbi:MAG: ferredoxin [Patescibacteria group bacterium]
MSIKVNQETCVGCGMCAGLCPEVFAMADDGKSKVIGNNIDCAKEAAAACPVEAITVS